VDQLNGVRRLVESIRKQTEVYRQKRAARAPRVWLFLQYARVALGAALLASCAGLAVEGALFFRGATRAASALSVAIPAEIQDTRSALVQQLAITREDLVDQIAAARKDAFGQIAEST
jgi:hypothetical protein